MNLASVLSASESAVDFGGIPEALSEAIGLSLESSQILLSVIVVLVVVLTVAIFTKEKITLLLFVFLALVFDVAVGWLNYIYLIITVIIVALMYAVAARKMLSGE